MKSVNLQVFDRKDNAIKKLKSISTEDGKIFDMKNCRTDILINGEIIMITIVDLPNKNLEQ